ncbi:MAG: PilZ domain-containing protein [Gammaproteobacteria bacterium]|nr:PilZ domain-containing protein [Gammaproteobacteria bacterium]MCF6230348.1 PilZ domain-containing protein [Gammaproteobacteria bacterium]
MIEKRRFTRIPFEATANIVNVMGSWSSPLIDISLKGALLDRPSDWEGALGDKFLIELDLDGGENAVSIRMEAEVTHLDDKHIGFNCLHIGLDSITHLRRLIELNLGDESILDRELAALIENKDR